MNRREFAVGAGLSAVATLSAAQAVDASTIVSPLAEIERLIDAHKAAAIAFGDAMERRDASLLAYRRANPTPGIARSFLGGGYGMEMGREWCIENLSAGYETRRKALVYVERLSPDIAQQVRELIDAKEADNIFEAHRQFDGEEACKESFGLTPLERLVNETSAAEEAAALALCSYSCASIEEVRVRAGYLQTADILGDGLTDEQMAALIASSVS